MLADEFQPSRDKVDNNAVAPTPVHANDSP